MDRISLIPSGFDAFWAAYPKKVAKKAAERAWMRLKPDAGLQERILVALGRHKQLPEWRDPTKRMFVPHPATWLNGERWEDDIESSLVAPVTTMDMSGISAWGEGYDRAKGRA